MKKMSIATVAVTTLMTPLISQAAGPDIYGRLHLSYGQVMEETGGTKTTNNWQMRSHSSRLGISGSRNFGSGLSGIYKIEFGINPDDDTTAGLSRRDQYLGLKGGFGEIRAGRQETPLKLVQGKFDQFNDTDADFAKTGNQTGESRMDNMISYLSNPGKMAFSFAFAPGEDPGTGGTADTGPADTLSFSFKYNISKLYVGAAHNIYENGANEDSNTLTRVVAIYDTGASQIGLLFQSGVATASPSTDEEDWLGVSFGMKMGSKQKFKAQYIMVEDSNSPANENTLMAVGLDHYFDKQTRGYVMYSALDSDTGNPATSSESTFLGLGMEYRF